MAVHIRIILAMTLALVLALTGQAMAVARGATDPSGTMVLCTGTGPILVHVDQSGTPTGPPAYCPDCALGSLAEAVVLENSVFFRLGNFPSVLAAVDTNHPQEQVPGSANARAPPFPV